MALKNPINPKIKNGRLADNLQKAAAEFIQRNSNMQSLITVSRIEIKDQGKQAIIFVTVFPQQKEHGAIDMLKRKRGEFRSLIPQKIKVGRIPFIDFEIDRAAELLREIDRANKNTTA